MLKGFFFEHFHMNRKASKCPVSGFLYGLIATENPNTRLGKAWTK